MVVADIIASRQALNTALKANVRRAIESDKSAADASTSAFALLNEEDAASAYFWMEGVDAASRREMIELCVVKLLTEMMSSMRSLADSLGEKPRHSGDIRRLLDIVLAACVEGVEAGRERDDGSGDEPGSTKQTDEEATKSESKSAQRPSRRVASEFEMSGGLILQRLLQELIESSSVFDCNAVIEWVERNEESVNACSAGRQKTLLAFNKMWIMLLRRFSKSLSMRTCGRVLLLMSKQAPLIDKGGFNKKGERNVGNTTVIVSDEDGTATTRLEAAEAEFESDDDEPMDMDVDGASDDNEQEEGELVEDARDDTDGDEDGQRAKTSQDESGDEGEKEEGAATRENGNEGNAASGARRKKIDYALYKNFWGLQTYFSDPALAVTASGWIEFYRSMRKAFHLFDACPITFEAPPDEKSFDETLQQAKYLTDPKLLRLQIRDPDFRRAVLIQAAILLNFLKHHFAKVADDAAQPSERARSEMRRLGNRISDGLELLPNGSAYSTAVNIILEREMNWAEWKRGGCPETAFLAKTVERPISEPPTTSAGAGGGGGGGSAAARSASNGGAAPVPQKRRKIAPAPSKSGGIKLGNNDLNRLWNNSASNEDAIADTDKAPPDVRDFLENVHEQSLDTSLADDEKIITGDPIFRWKADRLLMRSGRMWPLGNTTLTGALESGFGAFASTDTVTNPKSENPPPEK